jgi:hypothetical protein
MKKIIIGIIKYIGYLALVVTFILFYLSQKKMGLKRDFIFRNDKWMKVFFSGASKYAFIVVVILCICYLVIKYNYNREKYTLWEKIRIIFNLCIGFVFELLLIFSDKVVFSGLPMLLVSILIIFLAKTFYE